jgi:CRISPR-associated endoribonuclease Cas6
MDISPILSPYTPARLYAFLLKLRPLQSGTLMAFSGELVHAAFLRWLHDAAPDVSTWLHSGQKRRLFTCSSLQFGLPMPRMLATERENIHLPLDPQKTYTIRITLLLGELFPLLHEALTRFHTQNNQQATPSFIQLGKQRFTLDEIVLSNDATSDWTGFTSLTTLIEKAKTLRLGAIAPLTLEFGSLSTFSRSSSKDKKYPAHFARLPLPEYVFPNIAKRWDDFAPPELASLVQRYAIEDYIHNEGITIADYDLKTHYIHFTTHEQPGFLGTCTYHLRGPDDATTPESPLTVRQQILLLSQLAFYSGVGYKTAMGLGQTRLCASS